MSRITRLIWQSAAILAGLSEIATGQPANTEASRDVPLIRQTLNDVLSSNDNGVGTRWFNQQTSNYGVITPRTNYAGSIGQQCRAYDRTWVVNGSESTYRGSACKDGEGIWRVQGIETLASQRAITAGAAPPISAPPAANPEGTNQPPRVAGQSVDPAPRPSANPPPPDQPRVASLSPNPPSVVQPPRAAPRSGDAAGKSSPNAGPSGSGPQAAGGRNQPSRTVPPPRPLSVTLSGDELLALEQWMARLGLPVGAVDGTFDVTSQEAARIFWRNQNKTGDPQVDESFLTLVQIALSADLARGGVSPVVVTGNESIGRVPPASRFP